MISGKHKDTKRMGVPRKDEDLAGPWEQGQGEKKIKKFSDLAR